MDEPDLNAGRTSQVEGTESAKTKARVHLLSFYFNLYFLIGIIPIPLFPKFLTHVEKFHSSHLRGFVIILPLHGLLLFLASRIIFI